MTIKSGRWIRRMAEEQGMIEPFEAGQVRYNEAGEKLVGNLVGAIAMVCMQGAADLPGLLPGR